jgi:hypothetical protein
MTVVGGARFPVAVRRDRKIREKITVGAPVTCHCLGRKKKEGEGGGESGCRRGGWPALLLDDHHRETMMMEGVANNGWPENQWTGKGGLGEVRRRQAWGCGCAEEEHREGSVNVVGWV